MDGTIDYRIAFFTNTFRPIVGGVARSVELYQNYLKRGGDRVIVYAPEAEGDEESQDVRRLIAISHFNNSDFSLPIPLSLSTASDFGIDQFDVVHVHHPFLLGEMGMTLARQHRLPCVFTYHTMYEHYLHYVPFDHDTAERTILRHAHEFCECCDLVIAPTRDVEDLLRGRGVTSRIEVLPTGIELARYARTDGTALRRELGIASDAPVLAHVGRLAEEKNLPFLAEAALRALAQRPDAHWIVVGEGDLRPQLEKEALAIAPSGEGSRVHFLGRTMGERLVNAFAAGDLFIFASQSETQGMVIAEAMAAGSPVAALDGPGVRDLVRDGENGRLLPATATTDEFAQAMLDALDDRARREAWSKAARATAAELDMPLLATKLHGIYESLKLLPNHRLKQETMSFGLIRHYFNTVWENVEKWFMEL